MTRKGALVILAGVATLAAVIVLGLQLLASFTPATHDLGPGVVVEHQRRTDTTPSQGATSGVSPTVPVAPGTPTGSAPAKSGEGS